MSETYSKFRVILIDGKIKCIPTISAIHKGIFITKINRPWNPYWVSIATTYFENNPQHYMIHILIGK
jgi:hypothetical protein